MPAVNHPWRQYRKRRPVGPSPRERDVAEIMAECDCGAPGCHPGPLTASDIGERLGLSRQNVANVQSRIRKRLGWQAD